MLLAKVDSFTKFLGILSFMCCCYIEINSDSPEKRNFSKLAGSLDNGASIFIVNLKLLIYCNFKPNLLIELALSRLHLNIICSGIISVLLQNMLLIMTCFTCSAVVER